MSSFLESVTVKRVRVEDLPDFSAAAVIRGMRSLKGVRSAPEGRGRDEGDIVEGEKEGEVEVDEGESGADKGEEK
jgi:hypothetical protein